MRLTLATAALALLAAGCASSGTTSGTVITPTPPAGWTPAASPSASTQPASTQPASTQPAPGTRYPAAWKLPDRQLSPGAVQPGYTIADICPHVNPALEAMRPGTAEKNQVYAAYGITHRTPGEYEIDHIIPIELLGQAGASPADPARNLYPELNDKPDPAMISKYHLDPAFVHNSKDVLEDVLHAKVCARTVPLATAQHAIAADWRAAYAAYVGPPPAS